MGLPNCCGCLSLRTGTIVIGAIELVFCLIVLIFSLLLLINPDMLEKEMMEEMLREIYGAGYNYDLQMMISKY